ARPPDEDIIVRTDRRLLLQILLNLTSNAIKYTRTGFVRLEVGRRAGAPPRVAIRVIDSGIGIRPADQEKLFQAFQRLETPQAGPQEGSGLGLHLSQKMAGLLEGRIDVVSEYGKGSCFTLEIPA